MHYKFIYPNNISLSFNANDDNINSLYLKCVENGLPLYKYDEMVNMVNLLEKESRIEKKIIEEAERKEIDEEDDFWKKVKERVITMHKENEDTDKSSDNIKELWEMLQLLKSNNVKELEDTENEMYENIDMYFNDKASNEQTLRNEQEKEIQNANIENIPLNIIVNKHNYEKDNSIFVGNRYALCMPSSECSEQGSEQGFGKRV